ncbi:MAG: metallopeptidase family protein [Phycisphaerae bacterium]|nr:metallopeptidase family protein [Phycisphaerae bacterium]
MIQINEEEFEKLVIEAIESLPQTLKEQLTHIAIDIESMPERGIARRLGLRSRRHLLGLFHGVPLTRKSVTDHARLPSQITIYRENIRRICRTRRQIVEQVRKTVLHEIGHHFGLNEADLDDLGYQ